MATTITVSSSQTTSSTKESSIIRFDPSYCKTIPGILKIAEALCSLIGFICIQSMYLVSYTSVGGWYSFVSMSGFWISLLLALGYIFHIVERIQWIPWLVIETGFAGIWSVLFFIAACVAASYGKLDAGFGAAAFFGFAAMLIFGYEASRKFISYKAGEVPQGEKMTSTTNVETSTPSGPSFPTY